MTARSPGDLAADVRDGLDWHRDEAIGMTKAFDSLADLVARLETAEAELVEWRTSIATEALEAQVAALTQERDYLRERGDKNARRAQAAEAALAEAQQDIADADQEVDKLDAALADTRRALERAVYLAQHLFQMIDRETWRATGGDDGQGHYEGDYRAEGVADELRALAATGGTTGRADICPECGSGLLDGEHIAAYPCSRRGGTGQEQQPVKGELVVDADGNVISSTVHGQEQQP